MKSTAILVPAVLALGLSASAQAVTPVSPLKHIVVIFQENVSFDHYFATYPYAANPAGQENYFFYAKADTPTVNGLNQTLIDFNPNKAKPYRLDRSQAMTCDQHHDYTDEQKAYNGGLLDKFVEYAGSSSSGCNPSEVMGYYDGNTVTAYWNYAQSYAMSDYSFNSVFGPSTPGALNLVAGLSYPTSPANISGYVYNGTLYNDLDPAHDDCSSGTTVSIAGPSNNGTKNVADLLNAKGVTWGWFQGGFKPTSTDASGKAVCGSQHANIAGAQIPDYSPHHNPFQYWAHTSNPHHLPPTSVDMIGKTDQANHLYDITDLYSAVAAGNLPEVVFIKAPAFQDGHAGYSDPLDEQTFVVQIINALQKTSQWDDMAIFVAYDDSDGWYDHVMPPMMNFSTANGVDYLNGDGFCGSTTSGNIPARCGPGPRLPFLVVSPWARVNHVDSSYTEQASILRAIEDNWQLGRIGSGSFDERAPLPLGLFDFSSPKAGKLFLDPYTGQPLATAP